MRDLEEFAQSRFGYLGKPDKNAGILAIMVGDEVSAGIVGEQAFTEFKGHFQNDDIALLAQPNEQLPFHFERRRAVGSALFRIREGKPQLPNAIVADPHLLFWHTRFARSAQV